MKLNVFGKIVEVIRRDDKWVVFYLGNEGKKRLAQDILIQSNVQEDQLVEHISDLCHEWARPNNTEVTKLD